MERSSPSSALAVRMKGALRRLLILTHRYLGILVSLMLVVWFASGMVMIYAGGMPGVDPQERLHRLPPVDFSRVTVDAVAARTRAQLAGDATPSLLMLQERPAWRFPGGTTVYADDGTLMAPLNEGAAAEVARRFVEAPAAAIHFAGVVEAPDQWTLQARRELPLFKFEVDDDHGTELYVSPRSAEVFQHTTTRTRALAWVGTIPHWLYFASLRANQPLWYRTVVWLSSAACVLAVLGLVLAFTQWRRTRPLRLRTAIPYRGGMRWHYISGALFGVFALTWAFSGLMSMEPWEWTNAEGLAIDRAALSGGPLDVAALPAFDGAALAAVVAPRLIKELGFQRIQGGDYYTLRTTLPGDEDALEAERLHQPYAVRGRGEQDRLVVGTSDLGLLAQPFSTASILARLQAAAPDAKIIEHALLHDYDAYYYSRRAQTALPVLRVKFDDPMQTWVYVDPRTSAIVAQVHRYSRIERWLYNGLHSLDFRFWYSRRPLWDIGMLTLLLGGLVSSSVGFYLGMRRLVRNATRRTRVAA